MSWGGSGAKQCMLRHAAARLHHRKEEKARANIQQLPIDYLQGLKWSRKMCLGEWLTALMLTVVSALMRTPQTGVHRGVCDRLLRRGHSAGKKPVQPCCTSCTCTRRGSAATIFSFKSPCPGHLKCIRPRKQAGKQTIKSCRGIKALN